MNNKISFIVRVHNEEATLEQSINSITQLIIPYEVVIILNNCTDSSENIAVKLQKDNSNIKIYNYNEKLSKAGYETLCTDVDSKHSLSHYLNWCLSKCSGSWVFKWDADFIMSNELANYLNNELINLSNCRIKISATNTTTKNIEFYLSDNLLNYTKYYFWEVPVYKFGCKSIELPHEIHIVHNSELTDIKPYWKTKPWFLEENSEEAKTVTTRFNQLIKDFGIEPCGLARASNPICDNFFFKIKNHQFTYLNPHK